MPNCTLVSVIFVASLVVAGEPGQSEREVIYYRLPEVSLHDHGRLDPPEPEVEPSGRRRVGYGTNMQGY